MGSAALDLCSSPAGRLDAFVEEGLNAWDVAAGGLVADRGRRRAREARAASAASDCFVCAPSAGFEEFLDLVERCGFLA